MRHQFICTSLFMGDNDQSIHTEKAWDWRSRRASRRIHLLNCFLLPASPLCTSMSYLIKDVAIFCHEILCGVRNIVPNAARLLAVKRPSRHVLRRGLLAYRIVRYCPMRANYWKTADE